MSVSGIQGQLLEVTVVGCNKLKDTEWISRQDPYVCLEYSSTKYRTRTHKDGGKNPTFQEKFVFTLIEGLREFNVVVWNSNTLTYDDLIGSGKIQLHKVLSQGYDDSPWPLQDKKGRHAGEVRLILHYANANKPTENHAYSVPSAPPYSGATAPQVPLYSSTPSFASSYSSTPSMASSYSSTPSFASNYSSTPSFASNYSSTPSFASNYSSTPSFASNNPPPTSYSSAPPSYSSYPPHSAGYPPQLYNHQPVAYPPNYPPPPSGYPTVYPPPPQDQQYYPPGPYPPHPYPPPPY